MFSCFSGNGTFTRVNSRLIKDFPLTHNSFRHALALRMLLFLARIVRKLYFNQYKLKRYLAFETRVHFAPGRIGLSILVQAHAVPAFEFEHDDVSHQVECCVEHAVVAI